MILIRLTEEWFPRLNELDTTLNSAAVYAVQNGELQRREDAHAAGDKAVPDPREASADLLQLHREGGLVMGAQASGRLVALAAMTPVGKPEHTAWCTLRHCYTDRQWRNKGLGSALFRALSREALREGATQLYVPSLPAAESIDFWLRRGAGLCPPEQVPTLLRVPDAIPLKFALDSL